MGLWKARCHRNTAPRPPPYPIGRGRLAGWRETAFKAGLGLVCLSLSLERTRGTPALSAQAWALRRALGNPHPQVSSTSKLGACFFPRGHAAAPRPAPWPDLAFSHPGIRSPNTYLGFVRALALYLDGSSLALRIEPRWGFLTDFPLSPVSMSPLKPWGSYAPWQCFSTLLHHHYLQET